MLSIALAITGSAAVMLFKTLLNMSDKENTRDELS